MPFWSRILGATTSDPAAVPGEEYKGFRITPSPAQIGGQFRVGARIEKDGRRYDLVRADTMASQDEARAISLSKARQVIDEQGERIFS